MKRPLLAGTLFGLALGLLVSDLFHRRRPDPPSKPRLAPGMKATFVPYPVWVICPERFQTVRGYQKHSFIVIEPNRPPLD